MLLGQDRIDYIHLVDGGVADNLGVRVLYDAANIISGVSELSKNEDFEVKPFFIQIDFNGIQDKQRNSLLNRISTSLALPAEQVDELRSVARELLNASPEFQRLLTELNLPTF